MMQNTSTSSSGRFNNQTLWDFHKGTTWMQPQEEVPASVMFIPPWSGHKRCQPSAHKSPEEIMENPSILKCFCLLLPANSIEQISQFQVISLRLHWITSEAVFWLYNVCNYKVVPGWNIIQKIHGNLGSPHQLPALLFFHETKHALVQRVLSSGDRENSHLQTLREWVMWWSTQGSLTV